MKTKVIRIHNPMAALPAFWFKGIEAYSTRAMVCPNGITIVADCKNPQLLKESHQYLRELGLGPQELIIVKTPENGDLYQAIIDESNIAEIVDLVTTQGYKIEFFCTRSNIESNFLSRLGLKWTDVVSLPSNLADKWNNKAELREKIGKENGLNHLFPDYCIVNNKKELLKEFEKMLKRYKRVVIKPPLWASGLGMICGDNISIAQRYILQYRDFPVGTIIERFLANHVAMSIVTRFENGQIIDRWFTEQKCCQNDSSITYNGFIIGNTPRVTKMDEKWMEDATLPFYDIICKECPSLTGIINFDCLRAGNERFILECNARVTFSTYIQEIRKVLGYDKTYLVSRVNPRVKSFKELTNLLDNLLLKDSKQPGGIIPFGIGCLQSAGYCYFIAVAEKYTSAMGLITRARLKIE